MKNIYPCFFAQPLSGVVYRFCLTPLILIILHFQAAAQNFTNISWGTAASQSYATHEVHGEVVNGKLYIFGGYDVNKRPNWTPTKRASVYDPATNRWSSIADLPHTPNGTGFGGITHEGTATDGTNIYIAGGYTSNSTGTGQIFSTKQVWRYNVGSNTYTALPNLPQALAAGQLRYLNGKIHYMGGANASRADVAVHYALDLNNLAAGWKALAPLLNPTNHGGSAVYGGKIYYIGGSRHQDDHAVAQKTVQAYNPTTNTWTKMTDMPVGRDHISSSVVVVGTRIIVLGGETSHNVKSSLVSAYSPATNTWAALTPLPVSKAAGVAAVLNGNIHYAGGNFATTNYKGIPQTQTLTLSPLADAFVRNGSYSGINYGRESSLIVKSSTLAGYTRATYLQFSLGTVSNISSAKLRIYGRNTESTSSISISSYGVNIDSWTETGITFNNAPPASTAALGSVGVTNTAKYYEIDVTSYVKSQSTGDKVVSLLVKNPTTQNKSLVFNSKENSVNKPQLIISTTATRSTFDDLEITLSQEDASSSERFSVFPNPVKNKFSVRLPSTYEGNYNFSIADMSGRIYNLGKMRIQPGGPVTNIDISKLSLSPGIYFLKVNSEAKNAEMKLIVQ